MNKLLIFFFLLFFQGFVFSQAPVNDKCTGAIPVTPSSDCTPVNATLSKATVDAGYALNDVWFSFVATETTHAIDVDKTKDILGAKVFKPDVNLYDACGGTKLNSLPIDYTTIGSVPNPQNHIERTFTGLTIGKTYYYRVFNANAGNEFEFTTSVCVFKNLGSLNDLSVNAIELPVSQTCNYLLYSLSNATKSAPEKTITAVANPAIQYADVWFKAKVPANGRLSVILSNLGTDGLEALAFYTSADNGTTLTEIASDYNSGALSIDKSGLTPNTYIYIRVCSTNTNALLGTFNICASTPPDCGAHQPAGDNCSAPTRICDLNGYCGNTSSTYTVDLPGGTYQQHAVYGGASIENNSWLSFIASATSASFTIYVSNCKAGKAGNILGIQAGVYEGNCASIVPKSTFWSSPNMDNTVLNATNLTVGNEYFIMIDGNLGATCDYIFATNSGVQMVDAGPDQTYCNPNTNPLELKATGTGSAALKWSSRAGNVYTPNIGTTAALSVNPGPTVDTRYIIEATGTCTGTKDSLLVTMKNCLCVQPTINSQPRDTSVCAGSTVTYKVKTTGATSFQWKESKDGGASYTDLSNGGIYNGVTTNTLVLTNVISIHNSYKYKCIIKDITGKCSDSTLVLTLKVNGLPTATIGTTKTVCKGDANPDITITGANGTSNYTFTYNIGGGANLTSVSTGNTSLISVSTSSATTYTYNLVSVKDANNCSQNQLGSVIITVDPTNIGGTVNTNHTICSGSKSNLLTLSGNIGNVTKWQYAVSPFTIWKDTAISTSTFTSGNLTSSTQFRAVVKSGSCPEAFSTPVLVSVDPKSDAGTLNSSNSICQGQTSGTLSLTGNGNTIQKWQSAISPFNSWSDIAHISNSYTSGILNDTTQYRVIVKSGVCPADTSNIISINVTPNQTLNLQCGNSTNTTVEFTWDKINGATRYDYSYTVDNLGPGITGTINKNSIDTTITVSGMGKTVNFTLTPIGISCTGAETANCISTTCLKPTTDQIQDIIVCAGDNIDIPTFISPDSPESFAWTNSNTAIGLPIKGISDTLFKTALVTKQEIGIIKVNAYKNPCKGPTMTFKITVNPLPMVTTKLDTSICKGSSIKLKGVGAVSYVWSNGITDNVTFAPTTTSTYTVTGTDANSCKNTANVKVSVNSLPVITVSNSGPICASDSLLNLNQSGDVLTKWSWKSNSNAVFNDSLVKQPVVKKAINNEVFTLKGTDANGCYSFATTTLTINPLPSFNLAANTPCEKQTITLFCSSATANSYAWSHKNGYTNSQQNPTLSNCQLSDSGYYYLKFTDAKGCVKTDSVFVNIKSIPVFTPSAISPCESTPFSVKANLLNATSYSWSGPVTLANSETVLVSNSANPTTHNGDYSVTVTNINGCSDTKKVTVTVKPSPVISVSNNGPLCANDTSLSLNQTGDVLIKWSWKSDRSAIFNDSLIQQPKIKNAGNGEVFTLKGMDANGCSSSASTTLTVNPLPVFKIFTNTPCEGQTLNLSCDFVGATKYEWSQINGFTNTTQNPTISNVSLLDSGQYVLKLTDASNCSDTHSIRVKINSLPVFAPSYIPPCEAKPLLLKANYSSTTLVKRFAWKGPSNLVDTIPSIANTTVAQKATPKIHNGEYALTITDVNNCLDTRKITVTINPLPAVKSVNDFDICIGDSVILNGSGAVSYSWDKNIVDNTPFKPLTTTTYIVKGIDKNQCENLDTVTITVNQLPTLNVPELCENYNQVLKSNHAPAKNNAWILSDITVATIDPTSGKVQAMKAGKTKVTFTDSVGCTVSKDLIVNATPTITTNPLSACVNSQINLKANQSPAIVNPWKSTSNNSSINSISGQVLGLKEGTDSVSFTNNKGCKTSKLLTVYGLPIANFTSVNTICIDDTLHLINSTSPLCDTYSWDFGDGTKSTVPSHKYNKSGLFTISLTVTDSHGCQDTITKVNHIDVVDKPFVGFTFTPDSIDILNPEVIFKTNSNGKYFKWNFGDGKPNTKTKDAVNFFPTDEGKYYTVTLTASNTKEGCSNSYTQVIVSKEPVIYYIPNTFTPNGDEVNNTFQPIFSSGLDPYNYVLYIYDRWGELIFESHNVQIGWDGTYNNDIVGSNTYIWKLEFKGKHDGQQHTKLGHVNVIR